MRQFAQVQKRTLIAAPKEGDGPLLSRRADRELPGTPLSFSKPNYIQIINIQSEQIFQKTA